MEQNGIKIAPANGSDYFSIAVKTTRNDLPLTFDLLNEIINNASFEPQEIARVKAEQIQNIQKTATCRQAVHLKNSKPQSGQAHLTE